MQKTLDPAERFSFGKNWASFLENLNEDRIEEAEKSLQEKLGLSSFKGKTFLDVGCGSGLFSLAAYRLGAKVISFDYDHDSVTCALYLKEKFAQKSNDQWVIQQGSILDVPFLEAFPKADIVYSWGVLHHTGHMWEALENVSTLVKETGVLFISIYNDQGAQSTLWKWVKKNYVSSHKAIKLSLVSGAGLFLWGPKCIKDFFQYGNPLKSWILYGKNNRGMSARHDLIDWVGGYPFEVATPEDIFHFFKKKGFRLEKLKTWGGGLGCNEFVFAKEKKGGSTETT